MNVRPGLLLVLGVTGCVSRLAASPILANGSYHEFLFGPVGSFAGACNGSCTPTTNPVGEADSDSPWTFTGAATIRLVDLFGPGDRFQLFDNGVSLGVSSSIPASSPNSCEGDIGCALADARYSRLMVNVATGSHSLTIAVVQNNTMFTQGSGAFSVGPVSAVPEASSLSMALSSAAVLAIVGKARSQTRRRSLYFIDPTRSRSQRG